MTDRKIKPMLEDERRIIAVWEYGGEELTEWNIKQGFEFQVYPEPGDGAAGDRAAAGR